MPKVVGLPLILAPLSFCYSDCLHVSICETVFTFFKAFQSFALGVSISLALG